LKALWETVTKVNCERRRTNWQLYASHIYLYWELIRQHVYMTCYWFWNFVLWNSSSFLNLRLTFVCDTYVLHFNYVLKYTNVKKSVFFYIQTHLFILNYITESKLKNEKKKKMKTQMLNFNCKNELAVSLTIIYRTNNY